MAVRAASGATTYLLESEDDLAEIIDLGAALQSRGVSLPDHPPALVDAEGRRLELPHAVYEALRQVVSAMAQGQGVTIVPQSAMLTTQEAADFLGVSRPTLVRLLETSVISHEKRGRHRRVMLADLLEYQKSSRQERRAILNEMAVSGLEAGVYELTAGTPPESTR